MHFIKGVALAVTLFLFSAVLPACAPKPDTRASAVVEVDFELGHGTGTHLGNGIVLTAAHVVEDKEHITAMDSHGVKHDAEVLWFNKTYDVALIRIKGGESLRTIELSCKPAQAGQKVWLYGFPSSFGKTVTQGMLSGYNVHEIAYWKEAITVDATLGPGMSGGPVVSQYSGHIVGIIVGGNTQYPLNIIVPSSTICPLLGRV